MNMQLKNFEDLIRLIQIVYAWMPTMITPFYKVSELDKVDFENLFLLSIKAREGTITIDEETTILILLSRVTKNRLVGTSKVMMVLNPNTYPIYDSRVILAFNNLFPHSHITNESTLTKPEIAIKNYRTYKEKVSEIAFQSNKSIRQVEFLFYTFGKVLNEKK
jgi:hypothetical protein